MTTADRIRPAHRAWAGTAPSTVSKPSTVSTRDEHYVGKHRTAGRRGFALLRMFYAGKHRRRGR